MKDKYSFYLQEDEKGCLLYIGAKEDPFRMNFAEGDHGWGNTKCPKGITATVTRKLLPDGHLRECYSFENVTEFPIFVEDTEVGIYATFNDNYEQAGVCMTNRCHTHIFCGGEASYVMALRMGGKAPHLGMMMVEGALAGYSVERKTEQLSNDRGDFIFHPLCGEFAPGERKEIVWDLFWFEDRDEFENKMIKAGEIPVFKTAQCTSFSGETIPFQVIIGQKIPETDISITCCGHQLPYQWTECNGITQVNAEFSAAETGEYPISVRMGKKCVEALFYVSPEIRALVRARCRFIAEKQQYHGKTASLQGAYLIYDNEEEKIYYSHNHDHNGGRERVGMGALMALWLQREPDVGLKKSLDKYVSYVYRELYDRETGTVYNDINRNLDWHRKYNYPWMAIFQMELYQLGEGIIYLQDAYRTMVKYYEEGGAHFYAIGVPVYELLRLLKKECMEQEYSFLEKKFLEHADYILEKGMQYPSHEVNFEQSIVAPGISCLIQAYQITGEKKYIEEAKRQLEILYLFNGRQPDYHQFENAIRHWDGYWFGKSRMFGDTFPHYWSVTTGVDFLQYEQATGDKKFHEIAKASLRGCLNLFTEDGGASCAMIFPMTVNGEKGKFYDVWANDQDWALYYALKNENSI